MWRRAARSRVPGRGVAVILAVLVCGGALDWGHVGGDDRDCEIVFVHHDHSAHRLSAATGSPAPAGDHCFLCHSLRLLHHAVASRYERVAVAASVQNRFDADRIAVLDGLRRSDSSRAPPSIRL